MLLSPPRAAKALGLVTLVVALVGCGSSSSDSDAPEPDPVATIDDGATNPADESESTEEPGADASAVEASGDCIADPEQLSGSSTVVFDDGDVAPDLVMTFVDNENALDPSTLTVAVGQRFGIAHGEGTDLRVVKVGCATGQPLPLSVTAGFVIATPGTYLIIDEAANDYAGAEVGAVVVE